MASLVFADIIAIAHLGYVVFVVLGFALIFSGIIFSWTWTRNLWFRLAHLLAIGGVALEALLGIDCPLTVLEYNLRYAPHLSEEKPSFIGNLIDALLYYHAPEWLFSTLYTALAFLGVITFIIAPPTRKGHSGAKTREQESIE